ncbi:MAG: retroviral-like aspartic protease [Candidatus Syntrophoarchaeum sp.]|nr:retroviral-like aspartic protease [Candidatus Syntrophoarchaeum sp.]
MTIEFRYREEESEITGTILRPVAALEFKSRSGEWIEIRMYIDSGADMTLIPLSFGRLLGLELRKEDIKHLRGVGGGEVPVIVARVDIRMDDVEFPIDVAWALEEDVPPLLGRTDIFDRFKIMFNQGSRSIIFEESNKT